MKCTVSRPVEQSASDPEWPGPDRRKWTQTTILPVRQSGSKKINLKLERTPALDVADALAADLSPQSPSLRSRPVQQTLSRAPVVQRNDCVPKR